ncbi:MAG: cadherin domain-containing protein, partial [Akkermansiaceae bacterium]|nr:cadherin domain-containing protein [Akkermansiaceae bacterium]
LNVTTDRAVFDAAPAGRRQQVIISPTTTAAPGAGGVAYVGSYNWSTPRPCWSFYTTGKSAAEVISHELGHTLGLSHDGRTSPSEGYYGGHGTDSVGWAPIMGVGYYKNLTQWSKGEYLSANQTQDDLSIIANNNNNVGYRTDDSGDTLAAARYLEILANNSVSNEGIIERSGDIDAFRFQTTGGSVTLNANVVSAGPNLDILAEIVNAGTLAVVSQNNPDTGLNASITSTLAAGEYLFRVRGTGRGDPLGDGYTNYGSLGTYLITGTVNGGVKPDRFSIAENSPNGTAVGTVVPRNSHGGATLTYAFASGNTSGAFAINSATGAITVANSAALNFESLSTRWDIPAVITPFVTITNSSNPALNETVRVVLTVTDVNEAPVLAGASLTVLSATTSGAVLVTTRATDVDRFQYPTHAITGGNGGGFFAIHSGTGAISVAKSPITPATYNLTVTATDQGSPALATSATVTVTVIATPAGLVPGSIVRTYFDAIGSGTAVSNLTSNAKFPNNPDKEEFLTHFDGAPYGDNFGSTIRGYLIAPATGSYRFWIASDDASQLLFNSTGTSQSGVSTIASVSGWTERYAWTANSSQQSAVFSLTAGQAYYIEARHKEGGGGDHVAVAWTTPLDATRKVIPGIYLAPYFQNYAPKIPAVSFTVRENAIAGQPVGSIKPTDVNAANTFSEFTITAGNIDGVFGIDAATGRLFVARTGVLNRATRATYSLTVRTRDSGSPALTGTGTVTVNVAAPAGVNTTALVHQVWTGISGTALSGLTGNANYPFKPSSTRNLTSGFDSGTNIADNYGSRVRALVIPPTTGSYFFYLCTDDDGRLSMSNDASPAGAATIASITGWASPNQWDKYTSQKSAARSLTAGQKYYIEALQKEGGGGDHLQVAWTGPGIDTPTIIPASALEPFDINTAPSFSPASYTFSVNGSQPQGSLVGTVSATDPEGEAVVYAITSGDPGNIFAIGPDGRVTLANPAALTNGSRTLVVTAQDGGIGALYPLKSATANVTLTVTGAISQVTNPVLSPNGGNHIGPLAVTATSSDGATVRYTLDGSDPRTSGTAMVAPSPATISIPASGAFTLRAYGFKAGMLDSDTVTASYQTVAPDAVTWTNPAGGSWPVASNWLHQVVADRAGLIARFDTLALAANRTVTLDGSRTVGGLRLGDTSGQFSWTLAPGSGGTLTLDNHGETPFVAVHNGSATLTALIAGSNGLAKTGSGSLSLGANNTFTGNVSVNQGVLLGTSINAFGSRTNARSITVNAGATLDFGVGGMYGNADSTSVPHLIIAGTVTNSGTNNSSSTNNNPLNHITLNSGTLTATNSFNINDNWRSWNINGTITSTGDSFILPGTALNPGILLASGTPTNTNINVLDGTLTV